jgi:4-hydroxybenzoate polyprenyltransferase
MDEIRTEGPVAGGSVRTAADAGAPEVSVGAPEKDRGVANVASVIPRSQATAGASVGVREGQTFAGESLVARYASFVKLPHTLFTLPFAGVGVVLGSHVNPRGISVGAVFWILIAFTSARFAAMGFNRIVDRYYDALNPRTRMRELPSGRLSLFQANIAVAVAAGIFIVAAWRLNPLCGWLAPAALFWIFFYSYTKRFTAGAHAVLGFALAIAPVGAYLAVTGAWSRPWWALLVLAAGVTFWSAGFDIIYALQDESFDREHGLHSIPARLGARRALVVARVFHALSVSAFLTLWLLDLFPVGWIYLGGVALMAALLVAENVIVRDQWRGSLDLRRIDQAFFRMNVGISTGFLAFALLDRLILG